MALSKECLTSSFSVAKIGTGLCCGLCFGVVVFIRPSDADRRATVTLAVLATLKELVKDVKIHRELEREENGELNEDVGDYFKCERFR